MRNQASVVASSSLLAVAFAATFSMSNSMAQTAEEASAACLEAARLINEEQDIVGALDEARWCVESLQQMKQQITLTVFPEAVEGYTGGELNNQSAMGMTIIERTYANGDDRVEVSLTTGIAGGGLAALAQLGMGMATGNGSGKKIRVQKRTVLDLSDTTESQYMVQLKSGGMLSMSSTSVDAEQLLVFVRGFPIADLDDALEP